MKRKDYWTDKYNPLPRPIYKRNVEKWRYKGCGVEIDDIASYPGEFCVNIGQDRVEFALNILKASIKINYWKGICSGPMKIYQNYSDVYNKTLLEGKKKQEKSRVAFIPSIYPDEN